MSFGSLLKEFRERKGLSKVALATVIEKTDTYIRKIEVDGYTPPVFSLCLKLASHLSLSEQETEQFMREAFIERLHADQEFYQYLSASTSELTIDTKLTYKNPDPFLTDQSIGRCSYYLAWHTRSKKKILTKKILLDIQEILEIYIKKFGYHLQDLNCTANNINCLVDVSPNMNIQEFVIGLQNLLNGELHNRYEALSDYPNLWDHDCVIHTVGKCPTHEESDFYTKQFSTNSNIK
jgi:REP element-mobilizing transposase RayT/DNA-binding XRE family transcriptional regulator